MSHQTIVVLDFGSQFTQLIARRLRELSVYSEILPFDTPIAEIARRRPVGIILSGGPKSVSEEGAPKCIGVEYEMYESNPLAYLYKNTYQHGTLHANVSNATVRCLSNMKLERMFEERHSMSRSVREEVSPHSQDWGYRIGSVYIRKVHFRDPGMVRQIEQKVVNRLRQVTAAIQQDGNNRVNVIHSTAEREAAIEFARAAATRPRIVGEAIAAIARDPEICGSLFELLETQQLVAAEGLSISLIPDNRQLLSELLAARGR